MVPLTSCRQRLLSSLPKEALSTLECKDCTNELLAAAEIPMAIKIPSGPFWVSRKILKFLSSNVWRAKIRAPAFQFAQKPLTSLFPVVAALYCIYWVLLMGRLCTKHFRSIHFKMSFQLSFWSRVPSPTVDGRCHWGLLASVQELWLCNVPPTCQDGTFFFAR